jgi:recombinational DNA repair ATPase RecF
MPFLSSYDPFVSFRISKTARRIPEAEGSVSYTARTARRKTNFSKPCTILCYGASFRGLVDQQFPASGEPGFRAGGGVEFPGGGALEVVLSIRYDGQTKDIRLNGKGLRDRKELVSRQPCGGLLPRGLQLGARRSGTAQIFFDQCAGNALSRYIDSLRSYSAYSSSATRRSRKRPRFAGCAGSPFVRFGLA